MKIGLLSDTHSYIDAVIIKQLKECKEIWHNGDFGEGVHVELEKIAPLRGVYGNIDHNALRHQFPEFLNYEINGLKVLMIHIGGYPEKYNKRSKELIQKYKPQLFLSGHSHICKIMRDDKNKLIHMNPGAAGKHGFHKIRTMITFEITNGKINEVKVIELGPRTS